MPKINVTSEEYGDLVIAFLLDKILNPDDVIPGNSEFDKIVLRMGDKGMKHIFLRYFLDMDSNLRVMYRRMKDVFTDSNKIVNIKITPTKESEKEDSEKPSLIRKVIKKLLNKEEISQEEKNLIVEEFEEDY